MTETFIELTEDEFDGQYSPIPNHINPSAGWAYGESGGCLFETHGEEFEYVRRYDPKKVWTLIDGDGGDMYLISGLHFVNRVGYLLTKEHVPDNAFVQVRLPMHSDSDESPP
jgi:hypothetical protein